MGVVRNIDYDHFPKQADENYKYPRLGKRVKVCSSTMLQRHIWGLL